MWCDRAEQDRIPVMRGQWFTDGTWLPLEEEESDLIELEHLARFRGQQMQDAFDADTVSTTVDSKDGERSAGDLREKRGNGENGHMDLCHMTEGEVHQSRPGMLLMNRNGLSSQLHDGDYPECHCIGHTYNEILFLLKVEYAVLIRHFVKFSKSLPIVC